MKLENQVTSLELSKKLKELGVKQDSLFIWIDFGDGFTVKEKLPAMPDEGFAYHSAFTVAELGEMIPDTSSEVDIRWSKGEDVFWGECFKFGKQVHLIGGEKKEVDCRAKMLIYLLETDII